ncbi:hypothetical protein IEQ34_019069 [Dendrobium chrysotoxum]|uniref:Uncharacterized protein n=1 Tax=Dendrobium chrysotoxum TaxID=161865 RepID=A0AAV7FQ78_DENCH|nr:hypothetical protein IEQ34_019069 [Dendrobium chrysotoxum]
MSGYHLPSSDPAVRINSVALPDGEQRFNKGAKVDDVASTITGDLLMILHKNFHIPNDVVTMAGLPPPGYLTISETSLRAGLHFPPPTELVEILKRCGVCLSQFLYRAMSMTEAALMSFESSRVTEDFEKSIAFKIIIEDHIQEARDHIYKVEVKALEQQCLDDGFIRGFLKGVRLMQRKIGVEVEGLTPSQASDDFPPSSDGNEIESELQKAFALEVNHEVVDIE